jgi:hypothetical protein
MRLLGGRGVDVCGSSSKRPYFERFAALKKKATSREEFLEFMAWVAAVMTDVLTVFSPPAPRYTSFRGPPATLPEADVR